MLGNSIASLLAWAGHHPLLQATAIVLGTFILEDAATVLAAMQTADGSLSGPLALASLYVGIALGDLGLYGLGWLAARFPPVTRLIPPQRKEVIRAWLDGRVFKVVLISRFLPGMRLPTYTTCGFVNADLKQFALAVVIATICWTSLLFGVSLRIGEVLMDHFGAWRWAGAAGFAVVRRARRQAHGFGHAEQAAMKLETVLRTPGSAAWRAREHPLSFFEFWPDWLFYFPVALHWIALGLRYGDFSLPTAANPTITAGGLCGESKLETLEQVQGPARELVARYTSVVAQPGGTRGRRTGAHGRIHRLPRGGQTRRGLQRHGCAAAPGARRPCQISRRSSLAASASFCRNSSPMKARPASSMSVIRTRRRDGSPRSR